MSLGGTDLNLLVALHALLEEVNVTRAAAREGMNQPAMSAALSRLRRHYGDELLVRVGRRHELTPLARDLLPEVQQAIPLLRAALGLGEVFDPAVSERCFNIAMSDYAMTILHGPLRRRLAREMCGISLQLDPLPVEGRLLERDLLEHDFLVAPLGYALSGERRTLFTDRFVCVVDASNSRLKDCRLTRDDLCELPHAVASLGVDLTLVDRELTTRGVVRRSPVQTYGWLSLPFVVAGTDLVAILPERLARQLQPLAKLTIAPLPLPQAGLINSLWWHPNRRSDSGHSWLLRLITEVARDLELAVDGFNSEDDGMALDAGGASEAAAFSDDRYPEESLSAAAEGF